jgi:hypothetical protein
LVEFDLFDLDDEAMCKLFVDELSAMKFLMHHCFYVVVASWIDHVQEKFQNFIKEIEDEK